MGAASVVKWLTTEGRFNREPFLLTAAFAERCVQAGLPLSRIRVALVVLHPQDLSYLVTWLPGVPVQEERVRASLYPEMLRASPLAPMLTDPSEIRHRLDGVEPFQAQLLNELSADGHTDYFAQALFSQDRIRSRAIVYVTKRVGGFTDAHLQMMREILPVLSLVIEVHAQARRSQTLLDTYLGKMTGQRVLKGQIARGDGQTLNAVLWFCDLRGFTALSEALPGGEVLELLNDFFGVVANVVEEHGGEVLKFIGDGMLAIFPIGGDASIACEQAMAAALQAAGRMTSVNEKRRVQHQPRIDYGVALHVGEVLYGNIGSQTRLDFTVIGPAVNLASRIESQTKSLGESVLVSQSFYDVSPDGLEVCATVRLRGIDGPQTLYRRA